MHSASAKKTQGTQTDVHRAPHCHPLVSLCNNCSASGWHGAGTTCWTCDINSRQGLCPPHFLQLAHFRRGEGPFPGSFSGVMSHDCAFLAVSVDHNVFILITKRKHGGAYVAVLTLVNSLLTIKNIDCIVNLYFCFLFF